MQAHQNEGHPGEFAARWGLVTPDQQGRCSTAPRRVLVSVDAEGRPHLAKVPAGTDTLIRDRLPHVDQHYLRPDCCLGVNAALIDAPAETALREQGHPVRDADAARLSVYPYAHLHVHGHYSFALPDLTSGHHPLRSPDQAPPA